MNEPETVAEFAARMGIFMKNRAAFPQDELMKYAGQWIAWSPDGTAIVASSAVSENIVYRTLKEKGYDSSQCCVSYIDWADEASLGAASQIVWDDPPATATDAQ